MQLNQVAGPLLSGADADSARKTAFRMAVRAIRLYKSMDPQNVSLVSGAAGAALLFGYCHREWPNEGFDRASREFLAHAVDGASSLSATPDLWNGFVGIAWVLEHLSRQFPGMLGVGGEDLNEEVDEALSEVVEHGLGRIHFDLITGVVGIGVYALERLPRPSGHVLLRACIEFLNRTAVCDGKNAYWRTPGHFAVPEDREWLGNGYADTGLAHGNAGVVALLSRAMQQPMLRADAESLLCRAVNWLYGQRREAGRANLIPSKIAGEALRWSHATWCYGDPGVSSALLAAGVALNSESYSQEAADIASRAAALTAEQAGIDSCGLCHGSGGVGLIYLRLAELTGRHLLRESALRWFRHLLAEQRPEVHERLWIERYTLLSGPSGVILSLLSAISPQKSSWESLLLLPQTAIDTKVRRS